MLFHLFPPKAPLSGVIFQVRKYKDPRDACAAIVAESYRLWLQFETRTDDITILVVHINGLTNVQGLTLSFSVQVEVKKIISYCSFLHLVQQIFVLFG